jgi:hypothetical protein
MLVEITPDNRERYAVYDAAGRQHARHLFGRQAAEAFAAKLTGLVP